MQPRSHYLALAGREIHYVAWGRRDAPPLIMWHGLARTGRDFDDIAAALADEWRVLCPDTIGRGLSSWSPEPDAEYCFAAYAGLAGDFADALGLARFAWVGTSMGGALGIAAGAGTLKGRISRMVLNDIGPTLPRAAFERIRAYVGQPPDFASMTELEAYFRTIYQPFGAHTDAQWRRMAETGMRRLPNGRVTTHYDPAIVRQFEAHPDDFEQWDAYDALDFPTLVLRGETSDLLFPDVAADMARRGPRASVAEITGCGHAPALNVPDQIETVRAFLRAP
ncbi:MAG TPA: alpha/beta hydrolase [Acetobacteraceae bacterium]|nr:alpha/beta hydrolase [Acetobacteraceae bacterium]